MVPAALEEGCEERRFPLAILAKVGILTLINQHLSSGWSPGKAARALTQFLSEEPQQPEKADLPES